MYRFLFLASVVTAALQAQYKVEPAGDPPALAAVLAKPGVKVLKPDGSTLLEMWFAAQEPPAGAPEQNATLGYPHGALLGLVQYPARFNDRKGQTIKPGVYTMRYSFFPMNGDHQGVAPQRDFLILSPVAVDTEPGAKPAFDDLMNMSRKASGTPHPNILSFWKDDATAQPGIAAEGDEDQILHAKIGSTPIGVIVVGRHRE